MAVTIKRKRRCFMREIYLFFIYTCNKFFNVRMALLNFDF